MLNRTEKTFFYGFDSNTTTKSTSRSKNTGNSNISSEDPFSFIYLENSCIIVELVGLGTEEILSIVVVRFAGIYLISFSGSIISYITELKYMNPCILGQVGVEQI
jgi:hypothetical protein